MNCIIMCGANISVDHLSNLYYRCKIYQVQILSYVGILEFNIR